MEEYSVVYCLHLGTFKKERCVDIYICIEGEERGKEGIKDLRINLL